MTEAMSAPTGNDAVVQAKADKLFVHRLCGVINKATRAKVPEGSYAVTRGVSTAVRRAQAQVPPGEYHGFGGCCIPRPGPFKQPPFQTAGGR